MQGGMDGKLPQLIMVHKGRVMWVGATEYRRCGCNGVLEGVLFSVGVEGECCIDGVIVG